MPCSKEEPPADTVIILISRAPASLLPIILSPAAKSTFNRSKSTRSPSSCSKKNISPLPKFLAQLSQESLDNAIRLLKQGGNQLRSTILNQLAKGKVASYSALTDLASELAGLVQDSLHVSGNHTYLLHRDFETDIEQAASEILPLEEVHKALTGALHAASLLSGNAAVKAANLLIFTPSPVLKTAEILISV